MSTENFLQNIDQEKIRPEVIETLIAYKKLGENFENSPQVKLVLMPQVVNSSNQNIGIRDIAITTAVQCYAPGDALLKERNDEKQQAIADSTVQAGHHTTRMHANFTFHLKVTRDLAERTLHANPFYNSEQQSQRYVEAKQGNYEIPANLTPEQRSIYVEAAEYTNKMYVEFLKELHPSVTERVKNMYPAAGWNVEKTAKRLNSKIDKICQEVARYVLPIAQKTTMYHTLSELQILRLFRASKLPNFSDEGKYVIASMIEEIAKIDSSILLELDKPLPSREYPSFQDSSIMDQEEEFNNLLDGNSSKLLGVTQNPKEVLAITVRNILGVNKNSLGDEKALQYLMDPKLNPLLSDVYEVGMLDPLTSSLRQISVTFVTKLSHTAESQRQRQRRTPGAVPVVNYDGKLNYITPLVIRENPELKMKYDEIMKNIYSNVDKCLQAGISKEVVLKLLPNAHAIQIVETGDLFDWLHRFKQRLCFLAQEEFCFISIEQAEQLLEILPEAEKIFQAPCGVAHVAGTGKCPEGDRWCGKPVWKWNIKEYKKERLI